jgi:Raf kinase inhibitor-like YbhB/YbcL family protein
MMHCPRRFLIGVICTSILSLCGPAYGSGAMKISSPAFQENGKIPKEYTCDGQNGNPPLHFDGIPLKTQSLALIVDDPDAPAGVWTHWVMWNINRETRDIAGKAVPKGALEGVNSFKKSVYGGPCPPSGSHRYFFKLYALDTQLRLQPGATKSDLLKAMKGHVIAEAETMGRYR